MYKKLFLPLSFLVLVFLLITSCKTDCKKEIKPVKKEITENNVITAKYYNSDFEYAKGNYNGITKASDGKIYYVLCSYFLDKGAQMYSYDPATDKVNHLADLTEVCGEYEKKYVPQGKVHVDFQEYNGKLFFATHLDYYKFDGGIEKIGTPPEGYLPYQGGHVLSYDLKTGEYKDYCTAPNKEGILAMNMDVKNGRVYCIAWPSGNFFRYDIAKDEIKSFGTMSGEGELGDENTFQVLSRSIVVEPETGDAYYGNAVGEIIYYNYEKDELKVIEDLSLVRDYFGCLNPHTNATMGYQWRKALYVEKTKQFYGIIYKSNYVVSLCPKEKDIKVLDRMTSAECKRNGRAKDQGSGLCLALGNDGETLYYITNALGEPTEITINTGSEIKKYNKSSNTHLITYNIITKKYIDHGRIQFEEGKYPLGINSLTIGDDNRLYAISYINTDEGLTKTDLIIIENPLK